MSYKALGILTWGFGLALILVTVATKVDASTVAAKEEKQLTTDQHFELGVGKHSGRLYRIEIDVDALKVAAVTLRMSVVERIKAIEPKSPNRRGNYEAAKKALEIHRDRVFEALPAGA
jgi:hypothetical protein